MGILLPRPLGPGLGLIVAQYVGMVTRSPPFNADWWAQMPTMALLALVGASRKGGRPPRIALRNACARCGCEPPWPPPWTNDRCSASWIAAGCVNFWIDSGSSLA